MPNDELKLWGGNNNQLVIIQEADNTISLLQQAVALTHAEQHKIIRAIENELYDMATEYIWKRTISNLKECILKFGTEFVLEMLGRDADPYLNIDDILTESETINLAKELGIIDSSAQLLLMQQQQLINHFSSKNATSEMPAVSARACIDYCIRYVLYREVDYDIEFTNFRKRLYTETINEDDAQVSLIINSEYFYIKTVMRTLINLIKTLPVGGELDNALNNFQMFMMAVWDFLLSDDKYQIGKLYSEVVSAGNKKIAGPIKSALSKVRGFDYVPENLRSSTFLAAAAEFKRVHYGLDNFYNEPAAIKSLYMLGAIPSPALGECLSAALLCKIGNGFGVSYSAEPFADKIIESVTEQKWEYYLNNKFPIDNDILMAVYDNSQFARLKSIFISEGIEELKITNTKVGKLVNFILKGNMQGAKKVCDELRAGAIR